MPHSLQSGAKHSILHTGLPIRGQAAFPFAPQPLSVAHSCREQPMAPLLQLRDIALTLGGEPLLEMAELSISPGERIALVGRNGSGKSTLLRIAAGLTAPDQGTRFQQPSARLAFLPQEPDMSVFATALDYVLAASSEHDDAHAELKLDPAADPALSGGEAPAAGEPRDDARMRGVSRERLDRTPLDLEPFRIGRDIEIDCAEFV